ncbi:hypothetical protein PV327_002879 [Microctonus hyperodae]|uniref:Secreted protein n=1 Tax=Microctonus hyperodae TaxID=165561 RepID=A0AA39KPI0_MICHY|nr:hypothetical protein PV327_002879 [Microctonus hyperodae]
MSSRLEYVFGILILIALFESMIRAQEESKPVKINDDMNTKGIVGTIQSYLSPVSNVLLEYLNSALIHMRGEELPCTIFDLVNFKFACTKVTDPAATMPPPSTDDE